MSRKIVSFLLLFSVLAFSASGIAQTPTPQQIEQFKRLPKAQQEQLAKQMGFDLSMLTGSGNASQSFNEDASKVYPRGTKFDEFGNPIDPMEEMFQEEEEDELKLYGIDLFAHEPTTLTPLDNIPVPVDYVIGPGDHVFVQLYGKENQEYELAVNRDGTIIIPKLGPFVLASKRFDEAREYLQDKIKQQVIGVDVSIAMGQLRTMRVFVMGEAYKPGAYNVSSLSTITHALFASGGVSEIASLRNIQLKRNGELVRTLDLYDLLNHGDSSDDVQLQAGDVVFIPAVNQTVTVDGQVRRPAIYELKDEHSLADVIAMAGGPLPEAFTEAVSIKRYRNGAQFQVTASLEDPQSEVVSGDYITVPQVTSYVADSISLIGAVARPGKYQWRDGMRIGDLLGDVRKDLLPEADLTYVLILREINQNRDIEALQVDLTEVSLSDPQTNIELENNDSVLVFSRIESEILGDANLDDLAYTKSELDERKKEEWQKRIEDKLFWQQVGLEEDGSQNQRDDDDMLLQSQTLIELTESEREKILEFKDTTYYSRKRMLAPVIAKLREQARFGNPLQIVEVAGEVKVPGLYPLTRNASALSMIKAAGGLTESSFPQKSEITRTRINEAGVALVEHIAFSPAKVMAGAESVKIKSKDRLNLFAVPSWQEELKVTIVGEVEFPGEYTIRRGEKLSDLVARAGGLTSYADVDAAIFTRESLKEQERKNLNNLAEELRKQIASESLRRQSGAGAMVSYDEAKKLLRDLTKAEPVGRLVIDFDSILSGQSDVDVALEDGDKLHVPGVTQSVNVIGEVYVPTSHLYTDGLSYEDYIARSGGFRALADKGSTYIIRANGQVDIPDRDGGFWFSANESTTGIRPGDTIVVPFDADNVDNMTLWANATQIVYQLAVAVAAIGSL